jgi:hypothetical protein
LLSSLLLLCNTSNLRTILTATNWRLFRRSPN